MKRRHVLKALGAGCIGLGFSPQILAQRVRNLSANPNEYSNPGPAPTSNPIPSPTDVLAENNENDLKDYLQKIQNFNNAHKDDVLIAPELYKTFESTVLRLRNL